MTGFKKGAVYLVDLRTHVINSNKRALLHKMFSHDPSTNVSFEISKYNKRAYIIQQCHIFYINEFPCKLIFLNLLVTQIKKVK